MQERRVEDAGGWRRRYKLPTGADMYVAAYRRWYDAAGPPPHASHAVDHFRTTPLDKTALLDRHAQHTAHCTSCTGALKGAERAAKIGGALLLALGTLCPWIVASTLPAVTSAAAAAVARPASAAAAVRAALGLLRALGPLLMLGLLGGGVAAGREFAASIARRLTSGMCEYPPPRNGPADAAARELRTVEQGRRS